MDSKKYPEFRLDSFNLVNFLFRYWKIFLATGIVAFIISAAVSLTITPLFRSEVTLYPASNISEPGSSLFGSGSTSVNFGDEEATEKILQMLQSDLIRDYLVSKYDLYNHYGIDGDVKFRESLLADKMNSYISSRKTEYMSVKISVLDEDAIIAADMANDIAALIDTTFNMLLREAGSHLVVNLENQYQAQLGFVKAYEDSIRLQGTQKITGYRTGTGETGITISPYSPEMIRYSTNHQQAIADLGIIRQRYTEAKMAADESFSYTLIVNEARPSEKKASPRRSVITVISTLSALLFLLLLLIFIDGLVIPSKD